MSDIFTNILSTVKDVVGANDTPADEEGGSNGGGTWCTVAQQPVDNTPVDMEGGSNGGGTWCTVA